MECELFDTTSVELELDDFWENVLNIDALSMAISLGSRVVENCALKINKIVSKTLISIITIDELRWLI